MLFQHFDWDLTHQVRFLYIYFSQPLYELERPAFWKMLILWRRELTFLSAIFLQKSP